MAASYKEFVLASFTTDRLIIRKSNDDEDLRTYQQYLEEDEFLDQFALPYSDEIRESVSFTSYGVRCYTLIEKVTNQMIGYVGIKQCESSSYEGELEYHIFKPYRNMGYCQEACSKLIDLFFKGAITGVAGTLVAAEIVSDNDASRKVLQNLGFEKKRWGFRLFDPETISLKDDMHSIPIESFELNPEFFKPYIGTEGLVNSLAPYLWAS